MEYRLLGHSNNINNIKIFEFRIILFPIGELRNML